MVANTFQLLDRKEGGNNSGGSFPSAANEPVGSRSLPNTDQTAIPAPPQMSSTANNGPDLSAMPDDDLPF